MKRVFIILTLFVTLCGAVRAADTAQLWDEANTAYINENWGDAIALYDSIVAGGEASAKLYYNLGNAYFKSGRIGESILYYNKAKRLAPLDDDIAHNLAVANTYTKDRIEPLPEFFASRLIERLRSALSSDEWTVVSISLLAAFLAALSLYLLPIRKSLRKTGFFGGITLLILLVMATSFAYTEYMEATHPTEAIVLSSAAPVKSSPDSAGKDLFILHEGAKVEVRDALNGWHEISIANGSKGWIEASAIALID
jgi:tetratricopeptide (TPR) repeat protein